MTDSIIHRTSEPTEQFLATCKSLQDGIDQIEASISPRDLLSSETSNKMGRVYLDIADLFLLACVADTETAREAVNEARTRAGDGASNAPKRIYAGASVFVPEKGVEIDESINVAFSGLANLVSETSRSVSSRPFDREAARPKSVFCFADDYSACAHFDTGLNKEGLFSPSSLTLTVAVGGKVAQSFVQFEQVNRKFEVSTAAELALLVDHFTEHRDELITSPA